MKTIFAVILAALFALTSTTAMADKPAVCENPSSTLCKNACAKLTLGKKISNLAVIEACRKLEDSSGKPISTELVCSEEDLNKSVLTMKHEAFALWFFFHCMEDSKAHMFSDSGRNANLVLKVKYFRELSDALDDPADEDADEDPPFACSQRDLVRSIRSLKHEDFKGWFSDHCPRNSKEYADNDSKKNVLLALNELAIREALNKSKDAEEDEKAQEESASQSSSAPADTAECTDENLHKSILTMKHDAFTAWFIAHCARDDTEFAKHDRLENTTFVLKEVLSRAMLEEINKKEEEPDDRLSEYSRQDHSSSEMIRQTLRDTERNLPLTSWFLRKLAISISHGFYLPSHRLWYAWLPLWVLMVLLLLKPGPQTKYPDKVFAVIGYAADSVNHVYQSFAGIFGPLAPVARVLIWIFLLPVMVFLAVARKPIMARNVAIVAVTFFLLKVVNWDILGLCTFIAFVAWWVWFRPAEYRNHANQVIREKGFLYLMFEELLPPLPAPETTLCHKCGVKTRGTKFCSKCGEPRSDSDSAPPPSKPSANPPEDPHST